jgi:hypothetical protein
LNFALKYLLNALNLNWRDAATALIGLLVFPLIAFSPPWPSAILGAAFSWTAAETIVFAAKLFVLRRDGRVPLHGCLRYLGISLLFWGATLSASQIIVHSAFGIVGVEYSRGLGNSERVAAHS